MKRRSRVAAKFGRTLKNSVTEGVTVALLGQPNSGKSTLFNGLTLSHQRVGNWPGKTVEQKEGYFSHGGVRYTLVDLPGSYSLSAHSEEEIVTGEYIAGGAADVICIMADASQLERSLFMLADYAGIKKPAILLLNMIDVAKWQGKVIDCAELERKLRIPVVPLIACDGKSYDPLYGALERVVRERATIDDSVLAELYAGIDGDIFKKICDILPEAEDAIHSRTWIAAKIIEADERVANMISKSQDGGVLEQITAFVGSIKNGSLLTGECKFGWIEYLLRGTVTEVDGGGRRHKLSKFDRVATSRAFGKPMAIAAIIFGLIFSLAVAFIPISVASMVFPSVSNLLFRGLTAIGMPHLIVSLVCNPIVSAVFFTWYMSCFVFGISLVFGLLEEIGYMARVSFVFDGTMAKFGLHGKAVMPFLTSFACNIGGVAGTRVIDSWGQRVTTMAMLWLVPCSATWGVVALVSGLFFGSGAIWVILSLFAVAALHLFITSKVFGGALIGDRDRTGLIMELPPYHKPKWKNLFRFVFNRMGDVLQRGLRVVVIIAVVFWILSHTNDGGIRGSIMHRIGTAIEPVTMWFGLRWQMFIAFLVSIMGREASLGVMASAFGSTSVDTWSFLSATVRAEGTPELATALLATISRPEALAFIYAFFFGVPCFMTVAATIEESRSIKWTLRMVAYYVAIALILAAAAFRIGLFLDGKGRNACGRTPAWERGIDVAGNVFRRNFGEDPC